MNICSLIVHTQPERGADVSRRLKSFKGVEVHAGHESYKLVVTIENEAEAIPAVSDTMHALRDMEGVVSTILIYHYAEAKSIKEMNRESH
jgi:nitrate reductase NapD